MYGLLKFIYAKEKLTVIFFAFLGEEERKLWKYIVEFPWERGTFYNMPKNKEDRKLKASAQPTSFLSFKKALRN